MTMNGKIDMTKADSGTSYDIIGLNSKVRQIIKAHEGQRVIHLKDDLSITPNTHGEFTVTYTNWMGHPCKYNAFTGCILTHAYDDIMSWGEQ